MQEEERFFAHNILIYYVSAKLVTLKQKSDFLRMKQAKRKFHTKFSLIVVDKKPNASQEIRAGFITTKRIGIAVIRNKIRRKLKSAVREAVKICEFTEYDLIFVAKQAACTFNFAEIVAELTRILQILRDEALC